MEAFMYRHHPQTETLLALVGRGADRRAAGDHGELRLQPRGARRTSGSIPRSTAGR